MDEAGTGGGEFDLIRRAVASLGMSPPSTEVWSGDDTAVLSDGSLLTIDTLAEGVDFELTWASPGDVGYKALAVSISDIAAMGGRPERAVVSVAGPRATLAAVAEPLAEGLGRCAATFGAGIVGGDLSGARELVVTVALTGRCARAPVLRSGARPGDLVCVTGALGGAALGLAALREGGAAPETAIARQLRPRPRVAEGEALASAGATAMIDVSDGLASDLLHLLDASGAGCEIDPGAVPVDAGATLQQALTGGEDFELLATLPPQALESARAKLLETGTPLTTIGEVTSGARRLGTEDLEGWTGWDHLRAR